MILPWPRRTIHDVGPTGTVRVWKIPFDSRAADDEDALVRYFRRFDWLDPITFAELMGSRFSKLLFGTVEYEGRPDFRGSLGRWEDRVEAKPRRRRGIPDAATLETDRAELEDFDSITQATPGPLSAEEFEVMMRGESELMRRVHWRLMHE